MLLSRFIPSRQPVFLVLETLLRVKPSTVISLAVTNSLNWHACCSKSSSTPQETVPPDIIPYQSDRFHVKLEDPRNISPAHCPVIDFHVQPIEGRWSRDVDFPRSRISADSWKQRVPSESEGRGGRAALDPRDKINSSKMTRLSAPRHRLALCLVISGVYRTNGLFQVISRGGLVSSSPPQKPTIRSPFLADFARTPLFAYTASISSRTPLRRALPPPSNPPPTPAKKRRLWPRLIATRPLRRGIYCTVSS